MSLPRWINALLWGISVALSWLWGLGLFFSVQYTFQFGIFGLLSFAVPNALGLVLFGYFVQKVAEREQGDDGLMRFFKRWSKPFRLVFYLYQLLAITLTVFAIIRYLFLPLELSGEVIWLSLSLAVLIVLAAAFLLGEECDITSIKWSHLVQFGIALIAIGTIIVSLGWFSPVSPTGEFFKHEDLPLDNFGYWGYAIPIIIGFLLGPWLDLQQWQRAIQMNREKTNVGLGYLFGGSIFFCFIVFHGLLGSWVLQNGVGFYESSTSVLDKLDYGHNVVVQFMHSAFPEGSIIPLFYYVFLGIAILTTLDSGYIALRWFLGMYVDSSEHMLFSLLPKGILSSPIPSFIFAGLFSLFATFVQLELEYFMVFYASFFVGYEALGVARCFVPNSQNPLPQIKMFSMGCLAVVLFAFGYFLHEPTLMIVGSLSPLLYVFWLILHTDLLRVVVVRAEEVIEAASQDIPAVKAIRDVIQPTETVTGGTAQPLAPGTGERFEGNTFVYTFTATYQDTNSVGNVYFGSYPLWVGKTRELFFNHAMPDFDLDNTHFFILTRAFEHKFVREAVAFDKITVRIKVGDVKRKFCDLTHEVQDGAGRTLGKGKQTLFFVKSKDYSLIDIPQEVLKAFAPYM